MAASVAVYVEASAKRAFAGALAWPGWCRSGRDEDAALEVLLAYGPRYARAIGKAAEGFEPPTKRSALRVVERVEGGASTDFGVPGTPPSADGRRLTE